MVTKYTNEELKQIITDLNSGKFTKSKVLGTQITETVYLKSKWLGHSFVQNLYLEKLSTGETVISVSNYHYPMTEEGIQKCIEAINE